MSITRRYGRNPDFVFRRVGEEEILVPVRKVGADVSSVYLLNEVGAEIWARLETPSTREEILDHVTDTFEVDRETAAADLDVYLDELRSVGALVEEDA